MIHVSSLQIACPFQLWPQVILTIPSSHIQVKVPGKRWTSLKVNHRQELPCSDQEIPINSLGHWEPCQGRRDKNHIAFIHLFMHVHMCLCARLLQSCLTPCNPTTVGFFCPWGSPGQNTGVGWHALLQGIFPTQRSNLDLLSCRQILYYYATRAAHIWIHVVSYQSLNKYYFCVPPQSRHC